MIRQIFRHKRRRVLIDVGTQKDLFLADGKICTRNHRRVLANLRRVVAWARHNHIPVISTCDIYPNDNGDSAIPYCLDGTEGQKKINYTILDSRISFQADGSTDIPRDLFKRYRQVILNKRTTDPFEEPRIDRLLSEINATEFIIVGAHAEDAVKAMALGLLRREKKVTVITDAVGHFDKKLADLALRKVKAKGAKLLETKKLAGTSHLKSVGICHCNMCRKQTSKNYAETAVN